MGELVWAVLSTTIILVRKFLRVYFLTRIIVKIPRLISELTSCGKEAAILTEAY